MPNGKVDEGEMALIIGEGGLTKTTLARRKRIRANFQAFTMENYQKDLAELSMSLFIAPHSKASASLNQLLTNHALLMS